MQLAGFFGALSRGLTIGTGAPRGVFGCSSCQGRLPCAWQRLCLSSVAARAWSVRGALWPLGVEQARRGVHGARRSCVVERRRRGRGLGAKSARFQAAGAVLVG